MEHDIEEYKYIKSFNTLDREIKQFDSLISSYERMGKDLTKLLEEQKILIVRQEEPKQALMAFESSPTTGRRYKNLYSQLQVLFESLGEQSQRATLDRNDGLSLENAIYGSIIRDVLSVFDYEFISTTKSYYRYKHDGDFDPTPIRTLIAQLMDEVINNQHPPANYIELSEIRNNIIERILIVASEEYKANRITEYNKHG